MIQKSPDFCSNQINRHVVFATFWHDDIRIALGRLDKLMIHGFDHGQVLFDNRIQGPAPLFHIPFNPANNANIVIRIHIDFDIHQIPQTLVCQNQDAF